MTDNQYTNLAAAVLAQKQLTEDIRQLDVAHDRARSALNAQLRTAGEAILAATNGIDLRKRAEALEVLWISGKYSEAGEERDRAVREAIELIAAGGEGLREQWVGTKNYDRWRGQYQRHAYGYGPRHGYVVFSIGLQEKIRENLPLTPEQIEASIYYLLSIDKEP